MLVRFWGVRGSTPTPQVENLRYGGNTSCVEVRVGDGVYVFDCGTGFRSLGQQLTQEFAGQAVSAHVFVSHFHWDHIQGLPFFGPFYDRPENHFIFHCSKRNDSLKRVMEAQMEPPYFPVGLRALKAKYELHEIEEVFSNTGFFRNTKSQIVNISKIQSLCPDFGGRIDLTLKNSEKLIVSRQYSKLFKERLGIK